MIKYILLALLISGCAAPSERFVSCAPYISADGSKGFWDLERDQPVDGHVCDEVVVK